MISLKVGTCLYKYIEVAVALENATRSALGDIRQTARYHHMVRSCSSGNDNATHEAELGTKHGLLLLKLQSQCSCS